MGKCTECRKKTKTPIAKRCRSCHNKALNKSKKGIPINVGIRNGMWNATSVSYGALHTWVRKNKPRGRKCEECKKVKPLDLANKGTYDRNFVNWEWLCRKCHMIKDGRLSALKIRNATK